MLLFGFRGQFSQLEYWSLKNFFYFSWKLCISFLRPTEPLVNLPPIPATSSTSYHLKKALTVSLTKYSDQADVRLIEFVYKKAPGRLVLIFYNSFFSLRTHLRWCLCRFHWDLALRINYLICLLAKINRIYSSFSFCDVMLFKIEFMTLLNVD